MMMEAVRTSETSVDNHFTRQYNPEDSSEHHTRRRENLKSHEAKVMYRPTLLQFKYDGGQETAVSLRRFGSGLRLSLQTHYQSQSVACLCEVW
jgi:hypothetical protein